MVAPADLSWLEKHFAFYASYHNNPINQLIHIICVWPILWTAVLFFSYTPEITGMEAVSEILPGDYVCNLCLILSGIYFFYYLFIELPGIVGPLSSLLVLFSFVSANYVRVAYSEFEPWKIGTVVHIGCWIAQFYGHGAHEGRSPALLDNLFQAIMMAPLFVLMEVFFKLGYKPQFQKKIQGIVDENIKQFNSSRKKA